MPQTHNRVGTRSRTIELKLCGSIKIVRSKARLNPLNRSFDVRAKTLSVADRGHARTL